ncbi:MAG TPA: VOC family protein [Gemmatimonadales bacterium]|nr:VOC family protein [Gemmatimonadales bacterium]
MPTDIPFTPRREDPQTVRARACTVSLTVKDLDASLRWYRDIAAFMIDETWERDAKVVGATLKAGDVELWMSQDDGKKGWDRAKGEGMSMTFTTTQDIDMLANGMKSRGSKLEMEPTDMPWGARMFTVRDPDGFKISFMKENG